MIIQEIEFDKELLAKYDVPCPRYTSYPTALQFSDTYSEKDHIANLLISNNTPTPLSLYVHIPFCKRLCYFCGCNKVPTKNKAKASNYLVRLYQEIELQGRYIDPSRKVDQLHWGGGTPTFISHEEITQLMTTTRNHFHLHDDDSGEYSIEIDVRSVNTATIDLLRSLGFNRVSLGVQDFDPVVQKAINRIQPERQTREILASIRDNQFHSVCLELIYGLPCQTVSSFEKTLNTMIELNPDRISVYSFAYLPNRFAPQRRINPEDLPAPETKLALLQLSIQVLTQAGYVYIGMDHFAKASDPLAIAQKNKTLNRNFQGYSTHSHCDLIAMGNSAISSVGEHYAQNIVSLEQYKQCLENGQLPISKGVKISRDDIIRKAIIKELMCHFILSYKEIEKAFLINFERTFEGQLLDLKHFEDDGLVTLGKESITITPKGRLLIRNICSIFDSYYDKSKINAPCSKAI